MQNSKNYQGLTAAEVETSRSLYGSNVLTPPQRESAWLNFFRKFAEPLVVVLAVAGAMSMGVAVYNYFGDTPHQDDATVFLEPLGIVVAILLATIISFFFEQKAEKEYAVLNLMKDDEPVLVIRDGNSCEIPRRDVVKGDILLLSTGQEIPADAHLLESVSLTVDESTLTGELQCHKNAAPAAADSRQTYPTDCVLRGTRVVEGHGVAEVYAVGDATEHGSVFVAAQIDNKIKTPLNVQLEKLSSMITRVSYLTAFVLIIGRLFLFCFTYSNADFIAVFQYTLESFMLAVALVCCVVPEGLPMAVSLCLALSMRKMLKTHNLVRKMHACETMGATTVICTDKTGTLTQNRMQVAQAEFQAAFQPTQSAVVPAALLPRLIEEGMAVNSTAQLDFRSSQPCPLGNPTEGALLLWLHHQGVDYRILRSAAEILEEIPFTTERKYMSTTVRSSVFAGHTICYLKGAPEIILSQCSLPEEARQQIASRLMHFQRQAMRTLAFACRIDDAPMHFLGVVAISDPVRPEVRTAIEECHQAGIRVVIVTGDTQATAEEIGRQIGITAPGDIITRARPMDKKNLVERLQEAGEIVAVTGDGTNDAPALKTAHVGLSMGDGTSVAKEASDITILNNSFASITRAVMWGRSLYRNIQRFVLFQMTVCIVASIVVLVGAFTGMDAPLTVTQMLWVNLIMDTFAAMALASLPPDASVMSEKPRPRNAFIISRQMMYQMLWSGILLSLLLLFLVWSLRGGWLDGVMGSIYQYDGKLSLHGRSFFFTTFVFLQFWNLFNAAQFMSSQQWSTLLRTRGFMLIACMILVGQFLIVSLGGAMFQVVPLRWNEWLIIIVATSFVFWWKSVLRRPFRWDRKIFILS